MLELGCQGFQETDDALLCYLEKPQWNESKYESLKKDLRKILNIISSSASVRFKEIEEENWNERWERSIQPIEIGSRIVVKPSWADYSGGSEKLIIIIDPKMSFGTGYHETTRLTLSLLEKHLPKNSAILDVGTGTGILAIAAIKLGAHQAYGIDTDDWCIENATENTTANDVQRQVQISKRTLPEFNPAYFDLITANLTLNTNIEFLPEFRRVLRTNGTLLLSGLLDVDLATMTGALQSNGFSVSETLRENEWIALAATQRP